MTYFLTLLWGTLMAFLPGMATLHEQADELREAGKTLEAINLYNQVIVAYQEKQDYRGVIEALTGNFLSWKHLYYKTHDKMYALIAKAEAEKMLAIAKAKQVQNKEHLIHYLLGTAALLLEDYPQAVNELSQAIDQFPRDEAEKGDWMTHLGDALIRNGDKEKGNEMMLKGIEKIQANATQIDSFRLHVWLSGAYMRLAHLLKKENPDQSKAYLNQAQEIIDNDPRLVIRKGQLESYLKQNQGL